ncbi:CotH kinase family protein [Oleiagrimonas soli]|uniref:Spore coat protein CotH n=1 Tax=Oleiagrimonas soli TaxID=1543381 RepID=A0A099CT09_9GAMM|nr:CotH kinase family protein [Oleiagrimonas soli]KGI77083.1 hypothetical protein LF63_0112610 [Oleiagrimonas soli]MBB6185382.1 hypothetical protein [Oleiagrimonas soli]
MTGSSFDQFSSPVVLVAPQASASASAAHQHPTYDIYYADIAPGTTVQTADLAAQLTHVQGSMHVRGEATKSLAKKQYGVSLDTDPSPEHFLGMANGGKHWVFNDCGAVDFTLLRNVLAFSMQRSLGHYAPQHKFFELFICEAGFEPSTIDAAVLQAAYQGVYLNFDKIRFQPDRIEAPYDAKHPTVDYAIVQANQGNPEYLALEPRPPLTGNVEIYEPKLSDMSADLQAAFSAWYIDSTLTQGWAGQFAALYSDYVAQQKPIPAASFAPLQTTTDYPSFAAYFVLNEIAKDPDGYHKSTFMVKRKGSCYAGPLWDKNKSYGNVASCSQYPQGYVKPDGWLFSIAGQAPCWWHVMIRDPAFQDEVRACWRALVAMLAINPKQGDWIDALIDDNVAYLQSTGALARNAARWPAQHTGGSYASQVAELKSYLAQRIAWIDANLETMLASY